MQACNNNNDKSNEILFQFTREPFPYIHTDDGISRTEKGWNIVRMDVWEIENIGLVGSLLVCWRMARCFSKKLSEEDVKWSGGGLLICRRPWIVARDWENRDNLEFLILHGLFWAGESNLRPREYEAGVLTPQEDRQCECLGWHSVARGRLKQTWSITRLRSDQVSGSAS